MGGISAFGTTSSRPATENVDRHYSNQGDNGHNQGDDAQGLGCGAWGSCRTPSTGHPLSAARPVLAVHARDTGRASLTSEADRASRPLEAGSPIRTVHARRTRRTSLTRDAGRALRPLGTGRAFIAGGSRHTHNFAVRLGGLHDGNHRRRNPVIHPATKASRATRSQPVLGISTVRAAPAGRHLQIVVADRYVVGQHDLRGECSVRRRVRGVYVDVLRDVQSRLGLPGRVQIPRCRVHARHAGYRHAANRNRRCVDE